MENKEQHNLRKRKERWVRQDNKQWASIQELSGCCATCGLKATRDTMCVFDFHHVDTAEKETNIAELLANGRPLAVLLAEVKKCILLCSNCHRQLHYDQHLKERQRIINDTN